MYIKDFATKTGLSIDTLRYYEEEKLLIPARNEKIIVFIRKKITAGYSFYLK